MTRLGHAMPPMGKESQVQVRVVRMSTIGSRERNCDQGGQHARSSRLGVGVT